MRWRFWRRGLKLIDWGWFEVVGDWGVLILPSFICAEGRSHVEHGFFLMSTRSLGGEPTVLNVVL